MKIVPGSGHVARLVVAVALLTTPVARADQGWFDNQDGSNFACYDVAYFQANNLAGSGTRCVQADNTGTLSVAAGACASGGGTVTAVSATNPLFITGGASPAPNVVGHGLIISGDTVTSGQSLGAISTSMLACSTAAGVCAVDGVTVAGGLTFNTGTATETLANTSACGALQAIGGSTTAGLTCDPIAGSAANGIAYFNAVAALDEDAGSFGWNDSTKVCSIGGEVNITASTGFVNLPNADGSGATTDGWIVSAGRNLVGMDSSNHTLLNASIAAGGEFLFVTGGGTSTLGSITNAGVVSFPPALGSGGMMKSIVTTGTMTNATAGTDYQPPTTLTCTGSQWAKTVTTAGSGTCTQPGIGDLQTISGHTVVGNPFAGASNPSAISLPATSGLVLYTRGVPDALSPGAAGTDFAPVGACSANQFVTATNAASLTCAQPAFAGLSGTLACGQSEGPWTGDVSKAANSCTTALVNIPNDTTMAGDLLATAIASPSTPAAGKARVYVDSGSKNIVVKNDAGTVNHGIQTNTCAASRFFTAVGGDGSSTCSTVAFGDLTGSATCGQLPALTGDTHSSAGSCATVTDHLTDGGGTSFSTTGTFVAGQFMEVTAGNHIATNSLAGLTPQTMFWAWNLATINALNNQFMCEGHDNTGAETCNQYPVLQTFSHVTWSLNILTNSCTGGGSPTFAVKLFKNGSSVTSTTVSCGTTGVVSVGTASFSASAGDVIGLVYDGTLFGTGAGGGVQAYVATRFDP